MNALDPLTWSILLMLLGCALVVAEVFIPSGGVLGFLAVAAVMASVALAFYHSGPYVGFTFTVAAVVALPTAVMLGLKYWPKTAMGRRFLLELPTDEEVLPEDSRNSKQLIGKHGIAKTLMLPSGAVTIDGRTIDAVSQGMPIDPGQAVKVIEVRGNRVVVRPVDPVEDSPAGNPNDVFSRPLDELGIDSIDDPLS